MPYPDQPAEHEPQTQEAIQRVDASGEESAPLNPPPPGVTFIDVFVGRDGLRAGWSLLLYLAMLAVLLIGTGNLVHVLRHHAKSSKPNVAAQAEVQKSNPSAPAPSAPMPISTILISEGISIFAVAVATWVMGKIEGRPNSIYGLGGRGRLPNFIAGLGWGIAMLSLLIFVLRSTGLLAFDGREIFGGSAWGYGAAWFGGFLLVGLFEEYGFRGYLQFTLARGINGICDWLYSYGTNAGTSTRESCTTTQSAPGFWIAAVLLSFGFGFLHHTNAGESPIGLLSAGLISLIFCLSLWRTGSLWWAIGFHAAWDWAQSFLYGTADSGTMFQNHLFDTHPVGSPILSGGLTGPEGSVYILPILGLAAAVILVTLPNTRHNPTAGPSNPMLN
jgi:hypothetical protein